MGWGGESMEWGTQCSVNGGNGEGFLPGSLSQLHQQGRPSPSAVAFTFEYRVESVPLIKIYGGGFVSGYTSSPKSMLDVPGT